MVIGPEVSLAALTKKAEAFYYEPGRGEPARASRGSPGVFTLFRPDADRLARFRARAGAADLSFTPRGFGGPPPEGFDRDVHRADLGRGDAVFDAARDAVMHWRQFPAWASAHGEPRPPAAGDVVAITAWCGIWWTHACRVTAVEDTPDRYAVTYATLPDHAECGEERFAVERDPSSPDAGGRVWFDLRATSRPRHPLARFAAPLVRRLQRCFASDACARMRKATAGANTACPV